MLLPHLLLLLPNLLLPYLLLLLPLPHLLLLLPYLLLLCHTHLLIRQGDQALAAGLNGVSRLHGRRCGEDPAAATLQ